MQALKVFVAGSCSEGIRRRRLRSIGIGRAECAVTATARQTPAVFRVSICTFVLVKQSKFLATVGQSQKAARLRRHSGSMQALLRLYEGSMKASCRG